MNIYTDIHDIKEEPLEKGQYYIYVLENTPQGTIKIGRSSNIKVRCNSLSGSNGGGNKLKKIAVSKPTYLYSLEKTLHDIYDFARIEGEWFDGNKITFNQVVNKLESLMNSDSYELVNNIRKQITLSKNK